MGFNIPDGMLEAVKPPLHVVAMSQMSDGNLLEAPRQRALAFDGAVTTPWCTSSNHSYSYSCSYSYRNPGVRHVDTWLCVDGAAGGAWRHHDRPGNTSVAGCGRVSILGHPSRPCDASRTRPNGVGAGYSKYHTITTQCHPTSHPFGAIVGRSIRR
jgi:hypothetical protein